MTNMADACARMWRMQRATSDMRCWQWGWSAPITASGDSPGAPRHESLLKLAQRCETPEVVSPLRAALAEGRPVAAAPRIFTDVLDVPALSNFIVSRKLSPSFSGA